MSGKKIFEGAVTDLQNSVRNWPAGFLEGVEGNLFGDRIALFRLWASVPFHHRPNHYM